MILRSLLVLLLAVPAWADTGARLKADLRIRLSQVSSTNTNWPDTVLYRCLNMAQSYVAGIATPIERFDTVAGGSYQLAVPSGFIKLKDNAYLLRNGGILRAIPRVSMDSLSKIMGVITPEKFGQDKYVISQDGGVIMMAPLTDSTDNILVSFYVSADSLDSNIECSLSDEWESVLLDAAKVYALEKVSSPDYPNAVMERDKHIAMMFRSTVVRPSLGSAGDK